MADIKNINAKPLVIRATVTVEHIQGSAGITYVFAQAGINFYYHKDKRLFEEILLSDLTVFVVSKTLGDTLSLLDDSALNIGKNVSDIVDVSAVDNILHTGSAFNTYILNAEPFFADGLLTHDYFYTIDTVDKELNKTLTDAISLGESFYASALDENMMLDYASTSDEIEITFHSSRVIHGATINSSVLN